MATTPFFRNALQGKMKRIDSDDLEIQDMLTKHPDFWDPSSVFTLHTARFKLYGIKKNLNEKNLVNELINQHRLLRDDFNKHVSSVIGADHFNYMMLLQIKGESKQFIK